MIVHPLGYPVEIVTNSKAVLSAASQSWSSWPLLFEKPAIRFEIDVHRRSGAADAPGFEAPPGWLMFPADGNNFAAFDLESRTGYMVISEGALCDEGAFRYHWLEALVLTALDSVFFTPLHAACVARDGVGTLLCGDSGAGKSSLAYACAKRGWTLVSDDAFHLAPGPERMGVGGSNLIHLRGPARSLFPELDERDTGAAPNGKEAIEIDAAAEGFLTARHAFASRCFFLRRRPGRAAVRPFTTCAAIQYFLKYLFPRDTSSAERHLREFLSTEPCVLEYERIEDAIQVLES
jgi:HPr Serine kinase C-terminal domain